MANSEVPKRDRCLIAGLSLVRKRFLCHRGWFSVA